MSGRARPSFLKRQKEQKRAQKAAEKRAAQQARRDRRAAGVEGEGVGTGNGFATDVELVHGVAGAVDVDGARVANGPAADARDEFDPTGDADDGDDVAIGEPADGKGPPEGH